MCNIDILWYCMQKQSCYIQNLCGESFVNMQNPDRDVAPQHWQGRQGLHFHPPRARWVKTTNKIEFPFWKKIRPQGMIGSAMRRLVRGGCPSTLSRPFSSQVSWWLRLRACIALGLHHLHAPHHPTHQIFAVISMLADPNDESPANVDAAKEWRDSYPEFK